MPVFFLTDYIYERDLPVESSACDTQLSRRFAAKTEAGVGAARAQRAPVQCTLHRARLLIIMECMHML